MDSFVNELLKYLFGGFVAFMVKVSYDKYRDVKKGKLKKDFKTAYETVTELHYNLDYILSETGAERALILKSENGGGKPRLDAHLYSSIIHEAFNGLPSIKDKWQRQRIDADYSKLLSELTNRKIYTIFTKDLEDKSILKDNYISAEIKMSRVIELYEDEKKYIYMSLNYLEIPSEEERPSEMDVIRAAVTNLKKLFKKD
ncbi:MAG: hypothetical protein ACRBG0_27695 [Lewinella sp.]|uniref:hypothetical protein n=1 Tax=Lewinella sp. TaxID=2004506 RepID=UPI003D6AB90B